MRSRKTILRGSARPFLRWRDRIGFLTRAVFFRLVSTRRSRRERPVVAPFLDARRRAFLKYAAFGSVLFVTGKYLDPLINTLRGDSVLSEKTFQNFRVTETGKQLLVTDDDGSEVLTIDKENF